MAIVDIPSLGAAGALSGTDLVPVTQGSATALKATLTNIAAFVNTSAQPLDADLTALAALSGTNTIYYRSAANTWTAVTIGDLLSFSGGTLNRAGPVGYATGRFYALYTSTQATASAYAPTLDTTISLVPFTIRKTVTLASLNLRVVTGAASSAAKMGVWASNATTGAPTGTAITNAVSNTGQSTASNNTTPTIAASAVLTPGRYWYGVAVTTAAPNFRSIITNNQAIDYEHGISALSNSNSVGGYTAPFTYSNNITTLDLTAATLTDVLGATGIPIMWIGT